MKSSWTLTEEEGAALGFDVPGLEASWLLLPLSLNFFVEGILQPGSFAPLPKSQLYQQPIIRNRFNTKERAGPDREPSPVPRHMPASCTRPLRAFVERLERERHLLFGMNLIVIHRCDHVRWGCVAYLSAWVHFLLRAFSVAASRVNSYNLWWTERVLICY